MARHWLVIAKVEFLVWSSRFKSRRAPIFTGIFLTGILWAFYIVPEIWRFIISGNLFINSLLMVALPELIRIAMLLLWMLVLIYPILYALQQIKIGQWEIILSCDVSTRSLLVGTFVGKIPSYGLMVLFLAPVLMSPFILAYEVALLGQILMYCSILLVSLSTLWISNFVSLAVQAKIGESKRAEDLGKGLSMAIGLIAGLPIYGLVYFAGPLTGILGMNVFLLFPFTWGADMTSWAAILFSSKVTPEMLPLFETVLGFNFLTDVLLLSLFTLLLVGVAFRAADRVFTFRLGVRTETVTTIIRENVVVRGIRRVFPGPFGVLVVTSLKDFFRKAENLSKLGFALMMTTVMPVVMNLSQAPPPIDDPTFRVIIPMISVAMMLMVVGTMTFGGTGFIESKDHLWVIRSAPSSVEFVEAKLVSFFISAAPLALIPSVIVGLLMGLEVMSIFLMFTYSYCLLCCSIMVSIGVVAANPTFETTRSRSYILNSLATGLIILGAIISTLLLGILYFGPTLLEGLGLLGSIVLLTVTPLVIVGTLLSWLGARRLGRPSES
ncbi:MAG: hypothetical protein RTV72_09445 [Candidatus Thorarchaeota archaeon]